MIPNLKGLSLSLVAVFAISAMVVSVASAATAITTTSGATIEAEDTGNIKVTMTSQMTECEQVVFKGTAPAAAFTEITIRPTFNSCTSAGFESKYTGFGQFGEEKTCDFVFHANGTVDLVCQAGADVTIDAATCIVHIPAQNGLMTITYTTGTNFATGKKDLTADFNIFFITATHTDGFLCPFNGTAEGANMVIWGEVTFNAKSGGNPVDLTDD